jgi:hypothetical protein
MKSSITCFLLVIITFFFLVVVLFFRDRFLFFLGGYDYEMTRTTSVESFKAHAAIQKWRLAIFGLTLFLGIACFFTCRSMEKIEIGGWYYTVGKLVGIITSILMIVIFIVFSILPKRLV